MSRPRSTVGAEAFALASRLSDDLLTVEEGAFDAIRGIFRGVQPRAERGLAQAGTLATLLRSSGFSRRYERELRLALLGGTVVLDQLLTACAEMTAESIGKELTLCERAGPRRAKGSASIAQAEVATVLPDMVQASMDQFEERFDGIVASSLQGVSEQVAIAMARHESKEGLALRLFSETPLSMVGNGGRGVWWRTASTVEAVARSLSIELANTIRLSAMRSMNEAVE